MRPALLALCLLLCSGCATTRDKPSVIIDRGPAEAEILSRVFAAIDQAVSDLAKLPASPIRTAIALNLGVAQAGRLGPSELQHVEQAAAISAASLVGDDVKAEALAADAKADTAALLAAVESERAAGRLALEDERTRHAAELAAVKREADAKVHRVIRYGLAAAGFLFSAATIAGAILFAKFAALFSWFGRDVLLLTGVLSACAWFTSLAYGWAVAHLNWIMGFAAFAVVGIGVLVYSNIRHERMRAATAS